MRVQLAAALLALVAGGSWFGLARARAWLARRRVRGGDEFAGAEPRVLFFSTAACATCRARQEPALAALGTVSVTKLDAVAERELAQRFHVYTVPATVVLAPDGRVVSVNYGFASSARLAAQLRQAEEIGAGAAA